MNHAQQCTVLPYKSCPGEGAAKAERRETDIRGRPNRARGTLLIYFLGFSYSKVAGLENALDGIVACNQGYRDSIGNTPSLISTHEELSREMDEAFDQLKEYRREESELISCIIDSSQKVEELSLRANKLAELIDEYSGQAVSFSTFISWLTVQIQLEAEKQMMDQQEKESRAKSHALRLNRSIPDSEAK